MPTNELIPANEKPTFIERAVPALIAGSLLVGTLLLVVVVLYIVKGPAVIEHTRPIALGAFLGAVGAVIVNPLLGWGVERMQL